ncbi:MAG TPA: CcmD family protein [Candidatus Marinimicrobia bacterium]|nr:MAG: CcmD family protein [Candidatus Marinimicrobia bacterium CG_4_10_14_0_2_um_filter_48_9]PJA53776.1 MAG: CcmD family protein [Candidatus Marinimicrobia bacterium CG_4_9_14_3_um_filter_48_9]HCW77461.1 CcmD family protein [Candidatus Neomarinimicrobiota bacterium]
MNDGFFYLFLAYAVIWISLFIYIWILHGKTKKLSQDLTLLKELVEDRTGKGA